jgi:hypothetical protein
MGEGEKEMPPEGRLDTLLVRIFDMSTSCGSLVRGYPYRMPYNLCPLDW